MDGGDSPAAPLFDPVPPPIHGNHGEKGTGQSGPRPIRRQATWGATRVRITPDAVCGLTETPSPRSRSAYVTATSGEETTRGKIEMGGFRRTAGARPHAGEGDGAKGQCIEKTHRRPSVGAFGHLPVSVLEELLRRAPLLVPARKSKQGRQIRRLLIPGRNDDTLICRKEEEEEEELLPLNCLLHYYLEK
ncbi:hypothetical protein OPV22_014460 [Ensete ventricosum]|uniref:Uncharacterized protein n=1 Tax=Ensete ventricosum TaxID=4639 RepID=A0AAV8PQ86_ENSVE|nr:hypothetical protein OPV22_014460 [Ensete ventricosum]